MFVDLLCVGDEAVKQWWRRIPEVATQPVENELGVRPEGRRPAFRRKHEVIICVFDDQTEQLTAHDQGQQRRVQQNLYDVLLRRIELIQSVLRLQLPKQ